MDHFNMNNELVRFRPTRHEDLVYVMAVESQKENSDFVLVWPVEKHIDVILSEDEGHYIIENRTTGERVGYFLLAGLTSPHNSVELRRIVISEKGKGFGKSSIELIKKMVFEDLNAHRLWLDVKLYNVVAQQLYLSAGFVKEGILRDSLYSNGVYESMQVMSILELEYDISAS